MNKLTLEILDKKIANRYEVLFYSTKTKIYGLNMFLIGLIGISYLVVQ